MSKSIAFAAGVLVTIALFIGISAWREEPDEQKCPASHATSTVPAADVPSEVLIIPESYSPPPATATVIYQPTTTERTIERETRIEERETNNTETVREVEKEPEDNGGIISEVLDIL